MCDNQKIPKVIHYCWFGRKEKPGIVKKCIASWKKYLPDYEIKEWKEDNFDVNICEYTKQAYQAKKYAFVSDYARFYILYHYGGIYLDTDVEVLKSLDCFLNHRSFTGFESEKGVNPGLILGAMKGDPMVKELFDSYTERKFILPDGSLNTETVVKYTTEILVRHGLRLDDTFQLISGLAVYPRTYFCPKSYESFKSYYSKDTYTIHHFAATWITKRKRLKHQLAKILGEQMMVRLSRIKRKILRCS